LLLQLQLVAMAFSLLLRIGFLYFIFLLILFLLFTRPIAASVFSEVFFCLATVFFSFSFSFFFFLMMHSNNVRQRPLMQIATRKEKLGKKNKTRDHTKKNHQRKERPFFPRHERQTDRDIER